MIYFQLMDAFNRFRPNKVDGSRKYYAVTWGEGYIRKLAERYPNAFYTIQDEQGYYLHKSPDNANHEPVRASGKTRKRIRKQSKTISPIFIWLALKR